MRKLSNALDFDSVVQKNTTFYRFGHISSKIVPGYWNTKKNTFHSLNITESPHSRKQIITRHKSDFAETHLSWQWAFFFEILNTLRREVKIIYLSLLLSEKR